MQKDRLLYPFVLALFSAYKLFVLFSDILSYYGLVLILSVVFHVFFLVTIYNKKLLAFLIYALVLFSLGFLSIAGVVISVSYHGLQMLFFLTLAYGVFCLLGGYRLHILRRRYIAELDIAKDSLMSKVHHN